MIFLILGIVIALPAIQPPSYLPPTNVFKFNLDCEKASLSRTECNSAKRILGNLGQQIAKQLLFRIPILVDVVVEPLEDTCHFDVGTFEKRCEETRSDVSPRFLAARKDGGLPSRFPFSVVKQHINVNPSTMNDMTLYFNQNANWYFPKNNEFAVGQNELDFECNGVLTSLCCSRIVARIGIYFGFSVEEIKYVLGLRYSAINNC